MAFDAATRPEVFRRDAVNPSMGAPGAASMRRTARRKTSGRVTPSNAARFAPLAAYFVRFAFRHALRREPRSARELTRYAVSRRSASAYFSLVCWITCAGSCGPGAVLFQSSVSR